MEFRSHHAHDRRTHRGEPNGFPHHRRIGAECTPPEAVAQNRDRPAARDILLRQEKPSQPRRYVKQREQTGGHMAAHDALRF
jgi:hypothetical protein